MAIHVLPFTETWPSQAAESHVRMVTADDPETQVVADTYTELVAHMLGGESYLDAGAEASFEMRLAAANQAADATQQIVVHAWSQETDFRALSEAQLTALNASRDSFIDWSWISDELDGRWDSPVPLVVVATAFSPFTAIPRLVGDTVRVIDPTDDRTLILTQAHVGLINTEVNPSR